MTKFQFNLYYKIMQAFYSSDYALSWALKSTFVVGLILICSFWILDILERRELFQIQEQGEILFVPSG